MLGVTDIGCRPRWPYARPNAADEETRQTFAVKIWFRCMQGMGNTIFTGHGPGHIATAGNLAASTSLASLRARISSHGREGGGDARGCTPKAHLGLCRRSAQWLDNLDPALHLGDLGSSPLQQGYLLALDHSVAVAVSQPDGHRSSIVIQRYRSGSTQPPSLCVQHISVCLSSQVSRRKEVNSSPQVGRLGTPSTAPKPLSASRSPSSPLSCHQPITHLS